MANKKGSRGKYEKRSYKAKESGRKGIGSQVLEMLKVRGRELGYNQLYVKEIYHYNIASQKLFEKAGFKRIGETSKGAS